MAATSSSSLLSSARRRSKLPALRRSASFRVYFVSSVYFAISANLYALCLAYCESPRFVCGTSLPTSERISQSRLAKRSLQSRLARRNTPLISLATASEVVGNATERERRASQAAYEIWKDQFPLAAARRDFYGLSCEPEQVQARFLALAALIDVEADEALQIFRGDLSVLSEASETMPDKLLALRSVADSEEDVLNFLRAAPRSIATTTAGEIRGRGLANMLARNMLGQIWEMSGAPVRMMIKMSVKSAAREIDDQRISDPGLSNERLREDDWMRTKARLKVAAYVFFGTLVGGLVWLSYMDLTYGGPIHGKGICVPAALFPAYNLPDAEGNTRLACNCAPLYKWYVEPILSPEQKLSISGPKVESKNCGPQADGQSSCNPLTAGGCVWTAEDLQKDPSTWESRALTFWERRRQALSN